MAKSLSNARGLAVDALCRIERDKAYANLVLSRLLESSSLESREKNFATELTYGTLRQRGKIDWVINQFLSKPLDTQQPFIRNLLRITTYQLLFLSNIPPPVVCFEAVQLSKGSTKTKHFVPFINAICRKMTQGLTSLAFPSFQEDPVLSISINTSHPEWMIKRWIDQFGLVKTERIAEANNSPAPVVLRVNRLKTSVEALVKKLESRGVKVSLSPVLPWALRVEGLVVGESDLFQQGMYSVQDESSQLVGWIMNPKPHELIYDMCAAPGSKSTHLAELSGDAASIVAFDIHQNRLKLVEQATSRLGIRSITVKLGDATNPQRDLPLADKILIDAPCSGLGVLRRRVDLRWRRDLNDIKDLIELQKRILTSGTKALKPGGMLLYSTCSVDMEENIGNAFWLKEKYGLKPIDISYRLPHSLRTDKHLQEAQNGYLQLWPDEDDTDGFFIACFIFP